MSSIHAGINFQASAGAIHDPIAGIGSAKTSINNTDARNMATIIQLDREGGGVVTPATVEKILDSDTLYEYRQIFDHLDGDSSGEISLREMEKAFDEMGIDATKSEIRHMVLDIDEDSNGYIDFQEFSTMLFRLSTGTALRKSSGLDDADSAVQNWCSRTCPRLQTFRYHTFTLLDDPMANKPALFVGSIIMMTIFLSSAAFIVETHLFFHKKHNNVFDSIEAVCVIIFTVEYVLRLLCCPSFAKFVRDPLNWIDFLAILPFYIEISVGGNADLQFLRIMRVIRIARVLKLSRYASWLTVFGHTLVESFAPLAMVLFVISILMLFFSAVIFFVEGDADDASSTYESIPASMWWAIVTMTTVGFGDKSPSTGLGMVVASSLSLLGIVVLAVPISVVSANFQDQFTKNERRKAVSREQKQKLVETQMKLSSQRKSILESNAEVSSEHVQSVLMRAAGKCVSEKLKQRGMQMRKVEGTQRKHFQQSLQAMMHDWHPIKRAMMLQQAQALLDAEAKRLEYKQKQMGFVGYFMGKREHDDHKHVEKHLGLI